MKATNIIPVFKKDDRTDKVNIDISIMPKLSKFLERCLYKHHSQQYPFFDEILLFT